MQSQGLILRHLNLRLLYYFFIWSLPRPNLSFHKPCLTTSTVFSYTAIKTMSKTNTKSFYSTLVQLWHTRKFPLPTKRFNSNQTQKRLFHHRNVLYLVTLKLTHKHSQQLKHRTFIKPQWCRAAWAVFPFEELSQILGILLIWTKCNKTNLLYYYHDG